MRTLRQGLHRLRHPLRYRLLAALRKVPALSAEQLQRQQQGAFGETVRFAVAHTAFYRERLGPLIRADGPIDPAQLPLLTKQDVRTSASRMLSDVADPATVRQGHTGGSTGEPLMFYYDTLKHERMLAGMMRGFMMSGWRPGQRVLYLWGAGHDTRPGGVFGARGGGPFAVERGMAADRYTPARLADWLALIRSWRPVLLYGYASALDELAQHVLDRGERPPAGLLGVYSTAEPLQDVQRARLQAAFDCKVFNQYGCREVPNIAWECRHGSLHVFSDLVTLETVDGGRDPRLLVTSLSDRLMPFIRYELGDTGELLSGGCACGSPFPRLAMGLCRANDLVVTPDGRKVHPSVLNRVLYGLDGIRRYQWVQRSPSRLALALVGPQRLDVVMEQRIAAAVRRDVDARMAVEIDYVQALPRTPAGKHRFVIGLSDGLGS